MMESRKEKKAGHHGKIDGREESRRGCKRNTKEKVKRGLELSSGE